jgi:hypothetical protein
MIWREFTKRYLFIVGLSFMVIVMIGIKIAYKDVEWETVNENKSEIVEENPSVDSGQVAEEEINLSRDYPLWEKLPYSGDGFTIQRYEGELTLMVENRNEEVLETIKEINSWFLENNIATDSHRLIITNQIEN